MIRFYLSLLTLLTLGVASHAQQINLNVCNETSSIAARNACVSGYIESLMINEFMNVIDYLDTESGKVPKVSLGIHIDQIGNMTPYHFEATDSVLQAATRKVISKIRPLGSFKNYQGELLEDSIFIELEAPFLITGPVHDFAEKGSQNKPSTTLAKTENTESNDVAFAVIENVPVFPGCYGNGNAELKKCMSKYVTKHVVNNFNTNTAKNIGLASGKVRISVQFKIDRQGYVVNVRARAPRRELEEEAIRAVKSLPKMKPGKQRGKEVGVLYALPILFQYEESFEERRARLKAERKKKKKQ